MMFLPTDGRFGNRPIALCEPAAHEHLAKAVESLEWMETYLGIPISHWVVLTQTVKEITRVDGIWAVREIPRQCSRNPDIANATPHSTVESCITALTEMVDSASNELQRAEFTARYYIASC